MKKILLFLIAILSPIIFISKVNAAIRYPMKIYPSGLNGQTIQHAVINDANWYGYNSSHSTKKWAWQFDFSDLDDTKTYDLSGTILNQVSLSENLSSAVVTFNDKACTLNYSFSNNEILWSDKDGNNTYGNDFNYFSIGHMTTFTCENVEIRKDNNNYFNIYFEKNTTASYMSPLYLGINASSVMSGSQQETNDKLQDSINKQDEIKQEQEKTNDALTSDSEDESSSSCGMICKLKNILSYINPLSEKFFAYKLVELLIDALKSLIVPDDMTFVTDFVDALESKLGFIGAIPGQIIEFAINLVSASWTEFNSISFPSISIFGYNFWDSQEIDLTEAINIFKPFKYVTDCICVVLCARTLNKWREQFTGGSSE